MIEDSNPNLGIYDMTVEVSKDAPKFLRYKLNQNICNGGGSSGQTQTSGIDPEFKPDIQKGLGIARQRLEEQQADPSTIVAGLDPRQEQALGAQTAMAKDKIIGRGLYNTRAAEERALQDLAGENLMGASAGGSLGSARSQAAIQGALAKRAGGYQQQRQELADIGVEQLGQAGTTFQKQKQKELEAKDSSLDRFFNRLTGVAGKTTTTSSGGK
jgi:hypothetical protein